MAKGVCLSGKSAPFNQISQKSDLALYLIGQNSEERKDRVRGVFLRELCSFQSDLSLSTLSCAEFSHKDISTVKETLKMYSFS